MASTSANFGLIQNFIDPNTRTTFTVTGYIKNGVNDHLARTLCPHVLGYKRNGTPNETQPNERVLCWQLQGPGPNPGWHCYEVTQLVGIAAAAGTGWVMGTDYSRQQNCAQNDKFHVPY